MKFEIAARAIPGKRSSQQDAWRVVDASGTSLAAEAESGAVVAGERTLVLVADGVGGYAGGEEASNLACNTFVNAFLKGRGSVSERLYEALNTANAAIGAEQRRQPDKKDMSTTFIGIHLDRDKMTFVSVGDSLLLRYRDEEIHRVNLDHSYADVLDRRLLGSRDPRVWEAAITDPQRSAITLALSGGPLDRAEYGHMPQIATRPLLPGDVIIAASDGIETLDMVQIQNFVRQLAPRGANAIADGLIRAADGIGPNRRREPDNTTIVVVQVPGGQAPRQAAYPAAAGAGSLLGSVRQSPALAIGAIAAAVVLVGLALFLLLPRATTRSPLPAQDATVPADPRRPTPLSQEEAPPPEPPAAKPPVQRSLPPEPPRDKGQPQRGEPKSILKIDGRRAIPCGEQPGGVCAE